MLVLRMTLPTFVTRGSSLDDAEELKHIKNDVGSQLASMECVPRHNTIDCPTLYWAAPIFTEGKGINA